MIPKVIHYCWFGGKPLPNEVKKCIESWKKYCPDYEIIQWNESNYDLKKNSFIHDAYKNKSWAFVSDYARLDIIYNHGGIYLDTDVELLKNLDFLLDKECYFGIEQSGYYIATGLGFGAVAKHKAVELMLEQYTLLEFNLENKNDFICPLLNTKALVPFGYKREDIEQFVCEAFIFPTKYFDPFSPAKTDTLLCKETVSIHHYSASWTSSQQIMKRKIVRIVGAKRVNKIKELINFWGK